MSCADDRFLPTGTYAIINDKYNRSITLNKEDMCLSSAIAPHCIWTITLLKDKKWTIHGPTDVFLDTGLYADEGDEVLPVKNPLKPHQWVIKQHPKAPQCYMIYSPSQPQLFWSLPNAEEGTITEFSSDHAHRSSLWKFKKVTVVSDGDGQGVPVPVAGQPSSSIGNSFSVSIPAGWSTTVTSLSCGNCVNLVRIRRSVDKVLETRDFVSGWDTIDELMRVDGSDTDSLALPSTPESYVLLVEAFHSHNPERKDPQKLPEYNDLSKNLRVMASRPNDMKSFPEFQTFMIIDEAPEASGSGRIQNAIITIHTQSSGMHSARSSVHTRADSTSRPQFLYYCVFDTNCAIATKRPAYKDDAYLGRVMSKWLAPPYNAGSLRSYLSKMESIDPSETHLFATSSTKFALADDTSISLGSPQALGLTPEMPLALLTEVAPASTLTPSTESFYVPPDAQSPRVPRFLYYGVYRDGAVFPSESPVDMQETWVSRVDLDLVPPPLSVGSLIQSLSLKEGVTTIAQLFLNKDEMVPLTDDHILAEDDGWCGSTADDPIMFQLGSDVYRIKGLQFHGSQYGIINCHTQRVLELCPGLGNGIRDLHLYNSDNGVHYNSSPHQKFSFVHRPDGGVAFRTNDQQKIMWAGPATHDNGFKASAVECTYYLIPSISGKKYSFYISSGPSSNSSVLQDLDLKVKRTNKKYFNLFWGWPPQNSVDLKSMWYLRRIW